MKITNQHDISLPLAVWLLHDEYDYVNDKKYISVTTLMKPLKQIILSKRVDTSTFTMDIMDLVAPSMGSGLHGSIEKAWMEGHSKALLKLGYPESVVKRVVINPTEADFKNIEHLIPVYLEQRGVREIGGWKVGGKFDLVTDGMLQDVKSTSTFKWTSTSGDNDYKMQGSLYRWIHPEKITEDFIRINFIFTDFMKALAGKPDSSYPPHRVMHRDYTLMSVADTEAWVARKLSLLDKYWDAPESAIPECTDEELWKSDQQYKYFSDPEKAKDPSARSTRNFTELMDARKWLAEKGKGTIVTIPGEVKRCGYCSAASICKQRERYI